ncbi:hypothetical protein F383_34893 [Gossypium arboreum]|uniref:Uncharacterized protein n=1 Tax=Gossypium arboreum TaxID=29729 RepID=A0A0B0N199_GOSAR|nr:hypothetical protein F383_34893 [Gossypium arboreum]
MWSSVWMAVCETQLCGNSQT